MVWAAAVGEICDWGKFTAWWSATEVVELSPDGRGEMVVTGSDPRVPELQVGDRVVSIDGEAITRDSWARTLRGSRPDTIWRMRVTRGVETRDIALKLGQEGWRYITVGAAVLAMPLLLLWLLICQAEFRPNLDSLMLSGFVLNAALSIFLAHFLFFGSRIGGLLANPAEIPGGGFASALAGVFIATSPVFAIYCGWRWPAPLRRGQARRIAVLAAVVLVQVARGA